MNSSVNDEWISFLSAIPQYPVMGYFTADFIGAKHKGIFTALFTSILIALALLTSPDSMIQMVLMWVAMIALPLIFCRISRVRTILYLLIAIIIMNIVSAPATVFMYQLYPDAVTTLDFPVEFILNVRILMFPCLILSWYFSNRLCKKIFHMQQQDAMRQYLPFLLAETAVIVFNQMFYIFDLDSTYEGFLLSTLILAAFLIIDLLLIRTINRLNRAHDAELRLEQTEALLHSQAETYEIYQSQILALQAIRHDTANQLSSISYLVENGEYDQALEQLAAFRNASAMRGSTRYTGNATVDSILNVKSESIDKDKIQLFCSGTLPATLPLDPAVLCSAVSNLLDNSIHECKELDPSAYPSVIRFSSAVRHNFLIIRSENPCLPGTKAPDISKTAMPKPDAEHGWGLRILQNIAEMYDGSLSFSVDEDRFSAEIQLNLSVCAEEESSCVH